MNVLIVDDHALFVSGLKALLDAGGINVIGTARNGVEAVTAAKKLRPDVILMDVHMDVSDGLTATGIIKEEFPHIKIVMLTVAADDELLFEAIKKGASGFLLKNMEIDDLLECLSMLGRGENIFSPGLAGCVLNEFVIKKGNKAADDTRKVLTSRQEEVLRHIARGLTYKEVAISLGIGETTVKYHMNEILERLQLENRAQAIAYMTAVDIAKGVLKK